MTAHLRPIATAEPLVTRVELAEHFHVHPDTVDKMRREGMPSIRWGARLVRFRVSDCVAWLEREAAA